MAFPFDTQPILKHYLLSRWCCVRCGWFETGTIFALHAAVCPQCGAFSSHVETCEGQTTRALPFASKPRMDASPEGSFQVNHATGIVDKYGTDDRARRRAGLKATGRKRKDSAQEPAQPRDNTIWADEE